MAAIVLPFTSPATWVAIPILASAGSVLVHNPILNAPCYITIFVAGVPTLGYKCVANSSVTVSFPAGATCKAAACAPMTATFT